MRCVSCVRFYGDAPLFLAFLTRKGEIPPSPSVVITTHIVWALRFMSLYLTEIAWGGWQCKASLRAHVAAIRICRREPESTICLHPSAPIYCTGLSISLVAWISVHSARTHVPCASGSEPWLPLKKPSATTRLCIYITFCAPLCSCLDTMHPYAHSPSKHQIIYNNSLTALFPNRTIHFPADNVFDASALVSPSWSAWVNLSAGPE